LEDGDVEFGEFTVSVKKQKREAGTNNEHLRRPKKERKKILENPPLWGRWRSTWVQKYARKGKPAGKVSLSKKKVIEARGCCQKRRLEELDNSLP